MATNDVFLRPDAGDGTNGVRLRQDAPDSGGAYSITALHGTYALSGQTASLLKTKLIVASNGTYSLSGQTAILSRNRNLTATNGTYSLAGQSATVLRSKAVVASSGTYALTGQNATVLRSKLVTVSQGTYSLTGQNATVSRNRLVTPSHGVYSLSGQSVDITFTPATVNYTLTAEYGTYAVSGFDSQLQIQQSAPQASNWQNSWHNKTPKKIKEEEKARRITLGILPPEELEQAEEYAAIAVASSATPKPSGAELLAAMEAREAFEELLREVMRDAYRAEYVAQMWEQETKRIRRNRAIALLLLH